MATTILTQSWEATKLLKPDSQGAPHDVITTLNYYDDPGDGTLPDPVVVGGGTVKNERKMVKQPVTISDITGREGQFHLATHGFEYHSRASTTSCVAAGFAEETSLRAEYFPECEQIIRDVTGARSVRLFDHKVRRGPTNWHALGAGNSAQRGGLHRVHVDQSYAGAETLLRHYFPGEDLAAGCSRWQIINLWRPIKTIYKDPLAVADGASVPDSDLVAAQTVYPDHKRETWTVKSGGGQQHRWYFKYAQQPDELVLIKCFDTVADGVVRRAPHSAFVDGIHEGEATRESVEVRCFVFYD